MFQKNHSVGGSSDICAQEGKDCSDSLTTPHSLSLVLLGCGSVRVSCGVRSASLGFCAVWMAETKYWFMEMYCATKVAMSPTDCAAKWSGRNVYVVVTVRYSSTLVCVSLHVIQIQADCGCRSAFHLCMCTVRLWRVVFPVLVVNI